MTIGCIGAGSWGTTLGVYLAERGHHLLLYVHDAEQKQVAEQILALRGDLGEFGTLVYAGHDWADPALARRSMVLMAEEVMPAVNRALGE